MVNSSWCKSASIVPLTCSCTPNLELLTNNCHPFYLTRELTSVIVSAFYILPQADMDTALHERHDALTIHQKKHWDAVLIVAGDFNRTNLKRTVSNLHQYIMHRGKRTLDHCYTPFTRHRFIHCLENLTTLPSSSCLNTNKGLNRKLRFSGRPHARRTNQWSLCRTH